VFVSEVEARVPSVVPEPWVAAPAPVSAWAEWERACSDPATGNWATPAYSDPVIVSAAHLEYWAPDSEYSAAAPAPSVAFAPALFPPLPD